MAPVSGGTDTPSGAMGGLSLGGDQATQQQQQQAAEIRKYRQQQAAKKTQARYTAKDKAMARRHALDPQAALTTEKRQWIDNQRREAVKRQAELQIQQQEQQRKG